MEDLKYKIGLGLIEGVGPRSAKKLISYCGGVEAVFKERKSALLKIPRISLKTVNNILSQSVLGRAEEEIKFIENNNIQALFFLDKKYPQRLKYCNDGPVMLYTSGRMDLNADKIISIVGTRKVTQYGRDMCRNLIKDLKKHKPLVVSGMAYGVDIAAHKAALKEELQTVACVAHGLDRLYPSVHHSTAELMKNNGGIITEFLSGTIPDRENFPTRNRIIAGMADVTLVVESDIRGGSLITAELALGYNRDVMAVPGRTNDKYSSGCNHLIKTNKASLVTTVKDIEYLMNWDQVKKTKTIQPELFIDLNEEEEKLVDVLKQLGKSQLDNLSLASQLSISKTSSLLLQLEFKGLVRTAPGKQFELI